MDKLSDVWSVVSRGTMKVFLAVALSSCMVFLAYVSYHYNVLGGTSFTASSDETRLWANTFLALTVLQIVFGFIVRVFSDNITKVCIYSFLVCLITVSVFGAMAGRVVSTSKQENISITNSNRSDARLRASGALLTAHEGVSKGLATAGASSSSGTRVAAQNKISELSSDIDKAIELADEAAEFRANARITATDIFGEMKNVFFVIISICIELGMTLLSWFLGGMFLRSISDAFQALIAVKKNRNNEGNSEVKEAVKK